MKRVIIESPYAGEIDRNVEYARICMLDSVSRGEAPIASHLIYTQPGILKDEIPEERKTGIECGFAWWNVADVIVFYEDLGWSKGMLAAKERAETQGRNYHVRRLFNRWL